MDFLFQIAGKNECHSNSDCDETFMCKYPQIYDVRNFADYEFWKPYSKHGSPHRTLGGRKICLSAEEVKNYHHLMPKGDTVSSLNGKMKIKEYGFEGPRTGGGNMEMEGDAERIRG